MESKQTYETSKLDVDFYINMLKQIPGLLVVMDKHSRFIYSNNYTAKLFGYQDEESMLGIDAFAVRCDAVKCAEDFIRQDNYVVDHEKELTIFDVHGYATGETKVLLTKKTPFYKDGKVEGSICLGSEIRGDDIMKISASLIQSDKKYLDDSPSRSYTVNEFISRNELSQREKDCIFYLLRGFSMKEIGKNLGISWRTVESYLNNIKFKWGCQNKKSVIDCAVANGFLSYIPKDLLEQNFSHVLHEGDVL